MKPVIEINLRRRHGSTREFSRTHKRFELQKNKSAAKENEKEQICRKNCILKIRFETKQNPVKSNLITDRVTFVATGKN